MVGCPLCGERGCDQCEDGYFQLDGCPRQYLGTEFIEAVNLAVTPGGALPVAGGLLDQSHWFLQLKRTIDGECSRIESDRAERDGK